MGILCLIDLVNCDNRDDIHDCASLLRPFAGKQEYSESADLFGQGSLLPPHWIPDLKSQHGDPNNLINCSLYHCRAILKISSKSAHNLLSNYRISDWAVM